MRFLESAVSTDVAYCDMVDKSVKNSWKWMWLEEKCDKDISFKSWCKNIDEAGKCFCVPCGKTLVYGSSGKKALRNHANQPEHVSKMQTMNTNYKIVSSDEGDHLTQNDRSNEVKALVSLFLAENCLPFSMAPAILDFAKRLSKDPKTLHSVSMNRTAATYITCHGVAHCVKKNLEEKLRNCFFSLNIDEATNNAGTKFLNVMVQFYDEELERCVVQLLATRESNISTSQNITDAVIDILRERNLPLENVISVLMDNCNVMRGKKNGVEQKLRAQMPNLMDISGDTVHILNNACKKFFVPIEKFLPLQSVCSDIFFDIQESPKVIEIFGKIQKKLIKKQLAVIRPIPNRFNQMLTVTSRINELWDCLRVYYSSFFKPEDVRKFGGEIRDIFSKYELSDQDLNTIKDLLNKQSEQFKTLVSGERKDRIIHLLFDRSQQTELVLNLYRGVLSTFEKFIKMFQSSKPQAHQLHVEMFSTMKTFYSFFIKPEHIPLFDAKQLFNLDVKKPSLHLSNYSIFVGEFSKPLLMFLTKDKSKNGQWLGSFFSALKEAYLDCAAGMKKLPLLNETLIELSYLSPGYQRSGTTCSALFKLAEKLPNVIPSEQLGILDQELKAYCTDNQISLLEADEQDDDFRIDMSWWSNIFIMKYKSEFKYQYLSKLVKALLSIFSGPLVEASFNIMDDILESDRSRMTTFNYEALAIIKSEFIAKKQTTSTINISASMRTSVATAHSRHCKFQELVNSSSNPTTDIDNASNNGSNHKSSSSNSKSSGNSSSNPTANIHNISSNGGNHKSSSSNSKSKRSVDSSSSNCVSSVSNKNKVCEINNSGTDADRVDSVCSHNGKDAPANENGLKGKRKQVTIGSFFAKKPKLQ